MSENKCDYPLVFCISMLRQFAAWSAPANPQLIGGFPKPRGTNSLGDKRRFGSMPVKAS